MRRIKELSKYVFPFLLAVIIFAFFTNHIEVSGMLSGAFRKVMYVLNRFIIGFALAYLINFLVKFLTKRLRFPKALAITFSYLFLLGMAAWLIVYISPLMLDSVNQVVLTFPSYYMNLRELLDSAYLQLDPNVVTYIADGLRNFTDGIVAVISDMVSMDTLQSVLKSSTRVFMDLSFGFLISLYALIGKESLLSHAKSFVRAISPVKTAEKILTLAAEADRQFSRFLVGKFIDSSIMGVLFYICYLIFGIPLSPFLAIVAGVTNMIPYFGPIMGGVITVGVLLCFDPVYALYALIIVVVLQSIDGMLIGPKILGDAVGISPLLTIIAITIGGDLAGFFGMLIGVPALSVCKTTFYDPFIARRLKSKAYRREGGESEASPNGEEAPSPDGEEASDNTDRSDTNLM